MSLTYDIRIFLDLQYSHGLVFFLLHCLTLVWFHPSATRNWNLVCMALLESHLANDSYVAHPDKDLNKKLHLSFFPFFQNMTKLRLLQYTIRWIHAPHHQYMFLGKNRLLNWLYILPVYARTTCTSFCELLLFQGNFDQSVHKNVIWNLPLDQSLGNTSAIKTVLDDGAQTWK